MSSEKNDLDLLFVKGTCLRCKEKSHTVNSGTFKRALFNCYCWSANPISYRPMFNVPGI